MKSRRLLLGVVALVALLVAWLLRPLPESGLTTTTVTTIATHAGDSGVGQVAANGPTASLSTTPTAANRSSEPALDPFRLWSEKYATTLASERAGLLAEGRLLARARHEAMALLIQRDPQAAIANVLPYRLRRELPAEIAYVIEKPVRGRGDYSVLGSSGDADQDGARPIRRVTSLNGEYYDTYTYGERLNHISTRNVNIVGVGLSRDGQAGLLALRDRSIEILDKDEAAAIKASQKSEAICAISGKASNSQNDEQAVTTGPDVHWFCRGGHMEEWILQQNGQYTLAAAGGSGTSGGTSAVVPPTHAQGNKRLLVIRVRFPDQPANYEPVTDADLQISLQRVVNDWAGWSYGKLQAEYVFTPTLTAPKSEAAYAASGFAEDQLSADLLALAQTITAGTNHPYASAQFDFTCQVFSSTLFGTTYCGLAEVGGNRSWIRCTQPRVFAHEWGHNFGLWHANRWEVTTESPIGPGANVEYGGRYSTMNSGFFTFAAPAYNTAERWNMGWLSATNVATPTLNTTVRIYDPETTNLVAGRAYSLRVPKDNRQYVLEWRPRYDPDGRHESGTDNGAIALWHYNNTPFSSGDVLGTEVLDMNPFSLGGGKAGTADSPLAIGRTLSDPVAGVYFTVLGKGGTFPDDYADIAVRFEKPGSNSAPVSTVTASATSVAVNEAVVLQASATDPDGDSLAYWWDFGNDTGSIDNQPVQTNRWAVAGDYSVRCLVSDGRGGVTVRMVPIHVGTPGTYSFAGRITTGSGTPLAGALVDDGNGHLAYTDFEGRYLLGGQPAGRLTTLSGTLNGFVLTPRFSQPFSVSTSAAGLDFTAVAQPVHALTLEQWLGITGATVADLTGNPRFPKQPDTTRILADIAEADPGVGDNYGQRMRGWFSPPASGAYIFYIASDDASQLALSTDDQAANLKTIASVSAWTGYREWNRFSSQKSQPVNLIAGQRYYLEALQKEATGGDSFSLGADFPDGTQQRPLPASYFDPVLPTPPIPPTTVISVAASDPSATEDGDNGAFTVSRTGSTAAAITVYFQVSGTATAGSDYISFGLSVSIPAGSASTTIPVTPVNDSVAEPNETVVLTLAPTTAYQVGGAGMATVTITDDDPPEVSVVATDSLASENNSNTGTLTFTRRGNCAAALTVNYNVGGTATSGADYLPLSGKVTFAAGSDTSLVQLTPIADTEQELDESVVVTVASGPGYLASSPISATITITRDSGNGRGILREWWDGIASGTDIENLPDLASFPGNPTGREIVTSAFESTRDRGSRFGERWRALFTAGSAGDYHFLIASDDRSQLWVSTGLAFSTLELAAQVPDYTGFREWAKYPDQTSPAVRLCRGQQVYLEVRWTEDSGADHMSVGVQYPNGAFEGPIPADRLDPVTPATSPLGSPWSAFEVGSLNRPGGAGVDSGSLSAPPLHRYAMEGGAGAVARDGTMLRDSIGGRDGVIRGNGATFSADGKAVVLPGGQSDYAAYIDLPNGVASGRDRGTPYTSVTYEAWLTENSTGDLPTKLFEFGQTFDPYPDGEIFGPGFDDAEFTVPADSIALFGTLTDTGTQFLMRTTEEDQALVEILQTARIGKRQHVALVYDASVSRWIYYRDGVVYATLPDSVGPGSINDVNNWLGRSLLTLFPNANETIDEFRIYGYALTPSQVRGNTVTGPDIINLSAGSERYAVMGTGILSPDGLVDSLHFEAQALTGSVDLRTRLVGLVTTNAGNLAGLMLRSGKDAGALHAWIGLGPDGIPQFIARTNAGANAFSVSLANTNSPRWLRLVRNGGTLSGLVSVDGTNWSQVGSISTFLGRLEVLQGGFAIASGTTNTAAYALFDQLSISQAVSVTTLAASGVESTRAILRGSLNPNGQPTSYYFEYGTNGVFSQRTATADAGSGSQSLDLSVAIAGLKPHSLYNYRSVAVAPSGNTPGEVLTVTTLNSGPVAASDVPSPLAGPAAVTINVLANDTDADADALRIQAVTQGAHGTVSINDTANRVVYDPDDAYAGADSFNYTITDGFGGTATATVTLSIPDTAKPAIAGTFAPLSLTTGPAGTASIPNYLALATITDNVAVTASEQSPAAGTPAVAGVLNVQLTARDAAGNVQTRVLAVTVADGTAPTITGCPANRALPNASSQLPDFTGELSATDNVGVTQRTQSPAPGTTLAEGTHSVVLTARDTAGNASTCTIQVTILPQVLPLITFQRTNITFNANASCRYIMPDLTGPGFLVATGDAGPFTYAQSVTNGTELVLGSTYTNITTVTGANGAVACSTNFITLRDINAPVITQCAPGQSTNVLAGHQVSVPDFTTATIAVDCNGPVSLSQSPGFGTLVGAGTYSVTVFATDAASNTNSCTTTFTVNEVAVPAPEIAILGNTVAIVAGDTTPQGVDFTDFGSAMVGGAPVSRTFLITNSGNASLSLSAMAISGVNAADFIASGLALPVSLLPGDSTNFIVTFAPSTNGLRTALITVSDSDTDESSYSFTMQGTGVAQVLALTLPATGVSSSAATFNANVNPQGLLTKIGFQYGLTADYGSFAAATPDSANWTEPTPVSLGLTNLLPGNTYHYRVKATSEAGTVLGDDVTVILAAPNTTPVVAANNATVTVNEGSLAQTAGTFADGDGDYVVLTASVGTLAQAVNGTWSWSLVTTDGPDNSQTVTITATDSRGATNSTSFALVVNNIAPVVTQAGAVTVNEGETAANTGTWSDSGADIVTLSSSIGMVVRNANGTWNWTYATTDGPDNSQAVTITATDSDGASTSVTFPLTVNNITPSVASAGNVTVNEGQTASNTGTWSEPGADTVTLSASAGALTKNANGTWSWSLATTDGPDDSRTVTITATDSDGAAATTTFNITVNNLAPVLTNAGNKSANQGDTVTNSGTWLETGADTVTLTASVGTVVQNGNGTWSWSLSTTGISSQQVVISGTDSDNAVGTTSFNLVVDQPSGATFVWNGSANGGNWSTPANWTITSGTDADGIPDSNDTVVFNATHTTTSSVGANFSIYSLDVQAGYTGIISLGNNTLAVSGGFAVATTSALSADTGTVQFTGSQTVNSAAALRNVVVDVGADLILSSDLVLSLSGTLTGAGRFKNGGGKLAIGKNDFQFYTLNFSGTADDVILNLGDSQGDVSLTQDFRVNNSLTLSHMRLIQGPGALKVGGNVTANDPAVDGTGFISLVGGADQTLTGAGMVKNLNVAKIGGEVLLPADFVLTGSGTLTGSGHFKNTGGKLQIGKNDFQFYTLNFNGSADDLVLNLGDNQGDVTLSQGFTVNNTLTVSHMRLIQGPGVMRVAGNLLADDPAVDGTAFISLVGSADQSLAGSGMLKNLDISKTGGDVLLPSDFVLTGSGSLTGTGHFKNTGGKLQIGKNDSQFYTLNFNGSADDLVLNLGDNQGDVTLTQGFGVNNTLTVSHMRLIQGPGILRVGGNVLANDSNVDGTAFISLVGASDQTLTGTGMLKNLNVNKSSGDVLLPSDFVLTGSGSLTGSGRLRNTGGKLLIGRNDFQFYTLNFNGSVDDLVLDLGDNQGDVTLAQGVTVNHSLLVNHMRLIQGPGMLRVLGDVTANDPAVDGTGFISLAGATDQTLTGAGMVKNLNINKAGGDVLLPTDFVLTGSGSLTGGGHLRNTGGKLLVGKNDFQFYTLNFNGSVDDLVLNLGDNQGDVTLSQSLTVNNTLTLSHMRLVNGPGILRVAGDVTSNDGAIDGTGVISLVGSTDQTLTGSGMLKNLNVTKTGGNILLPTNFVLTASGTLSGGGHLRNTGGKLLIGKNDSQFYTIDFKGSVDDLVLDLGDNQGDVTLNQHLLVNNTLAVSHMRLIQGPGNLRVAGDVTSNDQAVDGTGVISLVGSSHQTLTGTGMLKNLNIAKGGGDVLLPTDFVLTAGGVLSGSGRIRNAGGRLLIGRNDLQFYTINFAGSVDDLVLNLGDNQGDVTLQQNVTVNNTLTVSHMRLLNGPGILKVNGNVTSDDPAVDGIAVISLVGNTDQTLTGAGMLKNLNISKGQGDVRLPSDFVLTGNGSLTGAGRIRNTGGKLLIGKNDSQFYTLNFAGSVDDLILNLGDNQGDVTLSQNFNINNSLAIGHMRLINGPGTLRVAGNITTDDPSLDGAAIISMTGSADQTLTGAGMLKNLNISKPGGDVLLPSDFVLTGNGSLTGNGHVRNTGGKLLIGKNDSQFYTLNFAGVVDDLVLNLGDNQGDVTLTQNISVAQSLALAHMRLINGPGALRVGGNVTSDDTSTAGAGFISLVGAIDQSLLGAGRLNNLDISKTGGEVLMSGFDRTFGQVTVSLGQWNVLGNTVTASSGFLVKGGSLTGTGTLVGPVTANAGAAVAPGISAPGILNTGNLVLTTGSLFRVRLGGTSGAGLDYDQVNVTGTVNLGNAILNLQGSLSGTGDSNAIVILNNDGADGISGIFADLPQNALITFNGIDYRISYNGGSGNDVTLTSTGAQSATLNATLAGGDLTVTDVSPSGKPNRTSVRFSGSNLIISDASESFAASVPAGASLSNGSMTLTIPLASVTGKTIFNLGGASDILTVDWSGGSFTQGIEFNGGTGLSDQLKIVGGNFATATVTHTGTAEGSMALDPSGPGVACIVNYTGVENVDVTGSTVTDWIYNLPLVASNAVLEDDGTTGNTASRFRSGNGAFAPVDFADPLGSLTLHRGIAGDSLTLNNLPDYSSTTILGSDAEPFGPLSLAGIISLSTNKHLTAFSSGTITLPATARLSALGSGEVALHTSRDIAVGSGASIQTVHGNVILEANLQSPATAANFTGIALAGGRIQTLGTGAVLIKAAPGTVGSNPAISLTSGSLSSTGEAGGGVLLVGDSINLTGGSIIATGTNLVALRPLTAAIQVGLGATDSANLLGLTDTELDLVTTANLQLGGTNSGPVTITAALSRSSATAIRLQGSSISWSNTGSLDAAGGTVYLDAHGGSITNSQPGLAIAGSVNFTAGDTFHSTLTSATAAGKFSVAGAVILNGVSLDLDLNGFTPDVGTTLTLQDNDGIDSIAGNFAGLAQGALLAGAGSQFRISYQGGTGNDIVLTTIPPQSAIALSQASHPLADGQTASVSFGNTAVGAPVTQDFVVQNTGTAPLNITRITVSGGFSILNPPSSIAPGASATFKVRLNATTFGSFAGTVTLETDDPAHSNFHFPVVGVVVNAAPTIAAKASTLAVGEGSPARNLIMVSDPEGDALSVTANVGTLSPSVPDTLQADTATGPSWRTAATSKALDADGDNVYGTDGYALWGLDGTETTVNPSYASITRNSALSFAPGNASYLDIDDPTNPGGPKKRTGLIFNTPGGTNATTFFTVTFNQTAKVRLGVLVDNADSAAVSPSTLRLLQVAGGTRDTGYQTAGTAGSRNRSVDYYFFDILAVAGDSFEVSGNNDAGAATNGVAGVFFDALGESLPVTAWSWTYTPDDGPSGTQVVTLSASDGVNSPVITAFNLAVSNSVPTASFAASTNQVSLQASGLAVAFTGQTDASTADTNASLRYSYDFDNDGVWEIGDGTYAGGVPAASANVPMNFLAVGGPRTVKGRLADKDGGYSDYTSTVAVVAPPLVATLPLQNVDANSATFTAMADAQSLATTVSFEYGTASNLAGALETTPQNIGSAVGPQAATASVSGLLAHTRYYVRAKASNSDGTVRGATLAFDTGNNAPIASNDIFTLNGSTATNLNVLANDSDLDGDALSVSLVSQSAHAMITVTGGGAAISYDPADSFVGTDSFTYMVTDGFGGTATASVTVTVPDSMAPVFVACAPAQLVDADVTGLGLIPNLLNRTTVTDNVGVTSLAQSPVAGSSVGLGTYTVTLTARDAVGNVNACSTLVTIRDVTAPAIMGNTNVAVDTAWAAFFTSSGVNSDTATKILTGTNGVYVIGTGRGPSGNQDFVTIKYGLSGKPIWTNFYNGLGNGTDTAAGAALGSDNAIYVTGQSAGSAGNDDVATLKIDGTTGETLWTHRYSSVSPGTDGGIAVAISPTGDALVAARVAGANSDILALKIAGTTGGPIWTQTYDGGSDDLPTALGVDASGDVYVAGWSMGATSGTDYITLKFDGVTGIQKWASRYNGTGNGDDAPSALSVTYGGSVIVTGVSAGSGTREDSATIRYDAVDGHQVWVARHNGAGNYTDAALALAVDGSGNALVTGYDSNTDRVANITTVKLAYANGARLWTNIYAPAGGMSFASAVAVDSDGQVYVGASADRPGGGTDFVAQKIDTSSGTNVWTKHISPLGSGDGEVRDLRVDSDGNAYLTGYSEGALSGSDFLTVKLTQPGTKGVASQTAPAGTNCTATVPDFTSLVTASDVNGPVTVTQTPPAGTETSVGAHTVTITATDAASNASTLTTTFTVLDTTPPVFTSAVADINACATNGVSASVQFVLPTATDTCSPVWVTADKLSGASFPGGTNVVTVTARDTEGNVATTHFNIMVNRPPVYGAYSITTTTDTAATISLAKLLGTVTDPDGDAVTITSVTTASVRGGTVSLGVAGITYTPPAGYSGGDSFTVTLSDGHCVTVSDPIGVTITQPPGNLDGAVFLQVGEVNEMRSKRAFTVAIERSTDLGVHWTRLGVANSQGNRSPFVYRFAAPIAAYYRFVEP